MNLTDSYKLSLYGELSTVKETDFCTVKLVSSSLDGKYYIKKEYADNKQAVFSVLQNIRSPHLPEIKEIIGGRTVVEEYVEGVTLEKLLSNGNLTEKQAKRIFKDVLEALDELHKHGIVHRDVKPSNIIIKPDGRAVLIDFGISKLFNAAAENDTTLFGTVGYAPPEQFGFSSTDYRSDIYSFGVTAEKLGIKSYKRIVNRCKAFDPSKRYANAGKVIASLRRRTPIAISVAAVLALLTVVLCLLPYDIPDNKPEYEQERKTEKQSVSEHIPVQSELYEQTEPITLPHVTQAPTYAFSTTRRLQLFDHQKPYRVIDTDEHIYSILIMAVEADEKIIVPTGDGGEIEVHYVLDRNNLKLTLNDGRHIFEWEHSAAQITMGEYLAYGVMTEIVFYDITGDGVYEIIPMFCHNDYSAVEGKLAKLVNSWEGYCIEYSSETGFSPCEGELRVLGSQSDEVFFSGGRILVDNRTEEYVISDGKFERK
ncbi:MAG: serine/threonine protein kinase [Clostridia bacterium]|nr:serine/threonine protein kinase [Clostridia bacterium]